MEEIKKSRNIHKRTKENQKIAQQLTDKITSLSEQAENKENEISDKLTKISLQLEESFLAKEQIEKIRQTIESSFNNYQTEKAQIDAIFQEIKTFQDSQFNPIVQQFLNEQNGVEAIINKANEKQTTINNLDIRASELFESLNNFVQQYQVKLENLNGIEISINELYEKAQNPDTGIEKKIEQIQEAKAQIDELGNQIKESHRISSELTNEIKNSSENVKKDIEDIDTAKSKSLKIQSEIDKIYNTVSSKLKGGWFDKTRKTFQSQQIIWLIVMVATIIATTIVAYNLYTNLLENKETTSSFINIFLRYATLSPLIFFLVFCARQYKLARISYEKYTFKTVLSISLPADIEILRDKFENEKEVEPEIMKFALNKLNSLYDEPYYDDAMKMKYQIELDKIRFGTEIQEENIIDDTDNIDSQNNEDIDD